MTANLLKQTFSGPTSPSVIIYAGLYWAWCDLTLVYPNMFLAAAPPPVLSICIAAAFFCFFAALKPSAWTAFACRPLGLPLLGLLAGAGTFLAPLALDNALTGLCGTLLMGIGEGALSLTLCRLCSTGGLKVASIQMPAGIVVGVLIDALVPLFTLETRIFIIAIFPLVASLGLRVALCAICPPSDKDRDHAGEGPRFHLKGSLVGISLTFLIAACLFNIGQGYMEITQGGVGASQEAVPAQSSLLLAFRAIVALAFVLLAVFLPGRLYRLFRASLILLVAAFAAVPFLLVGNAPSTVAPLFSNVGYAIFDIMTWAILCEVSHGQSKSASATRILGFGWGIIWTAHGVGALFGELAGGMAMQSDLRLVLSVSAIYLLVLGAVVLLQDDSGLWSLLKYGSAYSARDDAGSVDRREAAVRRFAGNNHLTARELDVLLYWSQSMTAAAIAERLCISEYTVRDHVKSIYEKCGVHNKQGLMDLIEQESPG